MKYAQFTELCQREWVQAGQRGDVCALRLTEDSRRELTLDALSEPGLRVETSRGEEGDAVAAGALLAEIHNPVTRTAVRVGPSPGMDSYEVSRVVPYRVLSPRGLPGCVRAGGMA